MAIQIYNTLTREKEIFTPLNPNQVKMYVCGPTVYNYIHIGNARSTVAFDTIRRYLEYRGYDVDYVSNFTDVDDKIIRAAQEEGLTPRELADKYIEAFFNDTSRIHIQKATRHPRVMDNMSDIIDYIQTLIEKDYAYEVDGDVYYRTRKFKEYGKLSHQSIDELIAGASERVDHQEQDKKEDPIDFALWKRAKDGEVSWESPWGDGRPGWHIECSVMSTKYLGDTFDIHGGGQDLEFPHHENEIAQAEAHSGQTFANYWMHNGFVTFGSDDEKMSKSLGNFILLRDLLDEVDPIVVRYLLGSVHYRRPLRYDTDTLQNAKDNIRRIKDTVSRLETYLNKATEKADVKSPEVSDQLAHFETQFTQAMDDDFNVANGLTWLFELIKFIHQQLDANTLSEPDAQALLDKLNQWLTIFGIYFETEEIDETVTQLIEARNQARAAKDYARADEIRDELKAMGIVLDDTPLGTTWKRVHD